MAEWLEVKDYAVRVGVSVDTAKRRARNGSVMARQEKTPSGFKWFIQVDDEPVEPTPSPSPAPDASTAELVAQLKLENERLWQEVDARRREVSELHILLQRAQSQIPIPAMAPAPQLLDPEPAMAVPGQSDQAAVALPRQHVWWAFWRRSGLREA